MIIGCVLLICITALAWQHAHHEHERTMKAEARLLHLVEERVSALERGRKDQYDPHAFEDLRSKVEAMRLAQGLKAGR